MASAAPRPEEGQAAGPADSVAGSGSAGDRLTPSPEPAAAGERGWLAWRPPAPRPQPPGPGRLDLGDAIHDGWQAFCRAPRVFAAFALLVNLLILLQQPLLLRIGNVARPSGDPRDWALYGLGLAVMAAVFLWGCLGLARGSQLALQGQRPTLMQLMQWDGRAWQRLLRAGLRLAAMVGLPLILGLILFGLPLLLLIVEPALAGPLGLEATRLLALLLLALLLLSLALTLAAALYLLVNQAFLLQIVLLEGCGGAAAVERGRQLVDPQWPLVLLLVIVSAILNGLGLLACVVGSLAAWPAVICIGTAAYGQLRQGEQIRRSLTAGEAAAAP